MTTGSHGKRLLEAVYGSFWAMDEGKFYAMLDVLDRWIDGQRLSAEEIAARTGPGDRKKPAKVEAGSAIAVLPLFGLISHRAHLVEQTSFGPEGTSTERFGQLFDAALRDPEVGTIVIDMDSPGGSVAGVPELAQKIFRARGEKRIIAVANALSASAAYWIGSAAGELVSTPSGEVGSVGVFAIHTNTARRDANAGIERTILRADIGPHKAELSPHGPLSASAQQYVTQQLNDWGLQFIDALAQHRGVNISVVRDRFGGGRTMGAKQALAAGLIDRVATLEEVLGDLGVAPGAPRSTRSAAAHAEPLDLAAESPESGDDAPSVAQLARALTDRAVAAIARPAAELTLVRPDAGEAAAGPDSPSLDPSATQAQEIPVTATATPAAPDAGAPSAELTALRARIQRETEIRNYCGFVPGITAEQLNALITSDKTAEQVRQELQAAQPKPRPAAVHGAHDRALDKKFGSVGEQLASIVRHFTGKGTDPRLREINALQMGAAATGMNETIGSEGGFFLQEDLVPGVMDPIYQEDPILSRVTRIGMVRNSRKMTLVDETARTNGNRWGGLSMQWVAEGTQPTASKPKTRRIELELKKLMGLGWITEEDKEDAPEAGDLLERAFAAESKFMLSNAVYRGPGAGQPLGFLNSGAVVSVAIEGTQTIANTSTFIATNTAKMLSRIPAWLQSQAIFLYNPELFPSIVTATLGGTAIPIFIPGGGMPSKPADTIWGKPAFASELCEAVGTPGDIVCIVPGEYLLADKGGPRKSTSIEVGWLKDEEALKIVHRVDGMPTWKTSVTPFKGSNALSPIVTLAVRT